MPSARLVAPLRCSPVLVLVHRAGVLWGANAVSSPVSCVLVEGRDGICGGIVDCPFCIYNLPAVCYSIGVEREQARKEIPK